MRSERRVVLAGLGGIHWTPSGRRPRRRPVGRAGPGEVWLVVSHNRDVEGRIPAILSQSRTAGQQADFVGIRVTPYD